eukprot:CAMPEP_0177605626 /NCGR_PEP_ID=MMETSP0419_2-20121207/16810_1 /TAXON_ID=582737 /ORGANISM="Tetraselmis sp., Strain GSL018" /LENGTH=465 /DNA_ID=CAMNT_0019099805 /DNA_START=428 /DNA_END=1827 /DNA_ORIENTATION=-
MTNVLGGSFHLLPSPWEQLCFCLVSSVAASHSKKLVQKPQAAAWSTTTSRVASNSDLDLKMDWEEHLQWAGIESDVKAAADLLVSLGLKDVGYQYVNVDDCWQGPRLSNRRITADPIKFPSGIKALADYVHSLGMKFGIYSDAGYKTCAGRPGSWRYEDIDAATYASWGVDYLKYDNALPGSWRYEDIDAATYASWGVDYLKYDNCFAEDLPGPEVRYPIMRDALNATGRPILYSMCEWGVDDPAVWGMKVGNSWRTTQDIAPSWESVLTILAKNNEWADYAGPGGFNDPDMLEVGVSANSFGPGLTEAEERSHFVLWSLMKAPLLIGADLRNISANSLELLKNPEVIAVNQVSALQREPRPRQCGPFQVNPTGSGIPSAQVWAGPLEGGAVAVALFNAGEAGANISATAEMLGMPPGALVRVRDLLAREDVGVVPAGYSALVGPHDIHFVRMEPVPDALEDRGP